VHSKILICGGVQGYYLPLLANWMHHKTLICEGVQGCKIYLYLLANECTLKPWFEKLFEFTRITYIY